MKLEEAFERVIDLAWKNSDNLGDDEAVDMVRDCFSNFLRDQIREFDDNEEENATDQT
jgi:hypothetical protein